MPLSYPPEISRRTHQAGWNEMVSLAAGQPSHNDFHANSLWVSLAEIARRPFGDSFTVTQTMEENCTRGKNYSTAQSMG